MGNDQSSFVGAGNNNRAEFEVRLKTNPLLANYNGRLKQESSTVTVNQYNPYNDNVNVSSTNVITMIIKKHNGNNVLIKDIINPDTGLKFNAITLALPPNTHSVYKLTFNDNSKHNITIATSDDTSKTGLTIA